MDIGFHEIADSGKHHPMTCKRQFSGECRTDYMNVEMASAITRPGMAGVTMALVDNVQTFRIQSGFYRLPDFIDSCAGPAHGNTNLNGRISTFA